MIKIDSSNYTKVVKAILEKAQTQQPDTHMQAVWDSYNMIMSYPFGYGFRISKSTVSTIADAIISLCESCHVDFLLGVTVIPDSCFAYTHLVSVDIPDSVVEIGSFAFSNCRDLKTVKLPEGLKTIGPYAFKDTQIKELHIPSTITELKEGLTCCRSLERVYLPKSIDFITLGAFWQCNSMKEIIYDGTMEEWKAIKKLFCWFDSKVHSDRSNNLKIICADGTLNGID